MHRISEKLVEWYRKLRVMCGKPGVSPERRGAYERLYPGRRTEALLLEEERRLAERLLLCFLLGIMLLAGAFSGAGEGKVRSIERPLYGRAAEEETLLLARNGGKKEEISLKILPGELSQEDVEELFKAAYEEVTEAFSEGTVRGAPRLPEYALEDRVRVLWYSRSPEYVNDWGEVTEAFPKEGASVEYELELRLGQEARSYEVSFFVFPEEGSEEDRFLSGLQEALMTREGEALILPEEYEGEQLSWYRTGGNVLWLPGVLLLLVPVLLPAVQRERLREALKKREDSLRMDYPRIITEFMILIRAGVTLRNAWLRMSKSFEGTSERSYVMEEMQISARQLESGGSESRVYREFGERCGISEYRRFASLLEQNLRQGSGMLVNALRTEAETALENRKNLARGKGEEALSKLLFPMLMNLCVVMVVVLVPALMEL